MTEHLLYEIMRKMKVLTFCFITLVTFSDCFQLPSSLKKCDKRKTDFNQCLSKTIFNAVTLIDKHLKLPGLPSLNDFEFPPDVKIEFGNSTYGLRQTYSKIKFFGLSKPQEIVARWDFGPEGSTLRIEAIYSQLRCASQWEAQGTVVLLPLNVVSPMEVILVNPIFAFTFELEEYEKGTVYFRVVANGLDVQVKGIEFDYKQIFSNPHLNDEFNSLMTAKGSQIFARFKHFQAILAPSFGSVLNDFLEKVPAAELFNE